MAELVGPREKRGCACPRLDAADCMEARSPRARRARIDDAFDFDDDGSDFGDREECRCACHADYEDSLRCEYCDCYPCSCGECEGCGRWTEECECPRNEIEEQDRFNARDDS